MVLMNIHTFLPPTDALHNDRENFQKILLCTPTKNQEKEKNREIKKMELENIIITSNNLNIKKMKH